jgi:hypothetical protein
MHYLHVQDFVNAYIGPFATEEAAEEHYRWTKDVRGDGAVKMGILTKLPDLDDPEHYGMVITPEQDKNWDPEDPGDWK